MQRARVRAATRLLGEVAGNASLAALVSVLFLGLWALLPLALGWTPAVVVSGSMMPSIRPGDVVFYQRGKDVRPNRILLADEPGHPGRLLSHRVVEINSDGTIVTKGDANPTVDSTAIAPSAVHGQARLVVPYIGLLTLADRPEQRSRVVVFAAVVLFGASSGTRLRPSTFFGPLPQEPGAGPDPDVDPDPDATPEADVPADGSQTVAIETESSSPLRV
jgi:signal peptidase I